MHTKRMVLPIGVLSLVLLLSHSLMAAITDNIKSGMPIVKGYQPVFKTLNSYLAYKQTKALYGEDSAKSYYRRLAWDPYLPLTGGTLTGDLYGTNAYFSGNMGVGNASARSALDVLGQGWFSANNSGSSLILDGSGMETTNTSSGVRIIASSSSGSGYMKMKLDNWGGFYSWAKNSASGEAELMRIDAGTGNVGIGTASPRGVLDVGREINGGAIGTVFARLPEADGVNEGTYLGVKAWDTQPVNCKSFSLEHKFSGYANNAINFYRGGGYQGGYMAFATNDGTEKMIIASNGNVGIGTNSPANKLDVVGAGNTNLSISAGSGSGNAGIYLTAYNAGTANTATIYTNYTGDINLTPASGRGSFFTSGNVGIGTTSPAFKLDVMNTTNAQVMRLQGGGSGSDNTQLWFHGNASNADQWIIGNHISDNGSGRLFQIYDQTQSAARVSIDDAGNVGIGTTAPGPYKLAVEGKIGAREIKVTLANPWADYVFDSAYQLKPLAQVEQYIKDNKHLPEVPSAEEVKKDGINLGDNQALLLKKIEELTLYMIEMQKENAQLKKRVEQLEKDKH